MAIMSCNWGRKVIATQRIDKGERILFVPRGKLITLELVRGLPLVEKLIERKVVLRSPKHTHLAIFLL